MTGSIGRLSFSGDEDIIKALSLNVITAGRENKYSVAIYNAHTGVPVTGLNPVEFTGNTIYALVNANVDIQFDETKLKKIGATHQYTAYLHLADNTTVFQIGANQGEDMGIHIGDMSARALGVNAVLVTDR